MGVDLARQMVGVVIRRNDGDGVGAVGLGLQREIRGRAQIGGADMDDDRHPAADMRDPDLGHPRPLLIGQRRPLALGAEQEKAVHPGLDRPVEEVAQDPFIDLALLVEGGDQRMEDALDHGLLSPVPRLPVAAGMHSVVTTDTPVNTPNQAAAPRRGSCLGLKFDAPKAQSGPECRPGG